MGEWEEERKGRTETETQEEREINADEMERE